MHSLFSVAAEEFGSVNLLVVGNGAGERRLAHVLVFDKVVVPDLDGDRLGGEPAIEDKLFIESRIEIVVDRFRPANFTAETQTLFAFHDAIRVGAAHGVLNQWK